MIIAAVSDTHGDTRGIERVLAYVRPAALVHLGDGERDAESMAAHVPGVEIIAVGGNCDHPGRNDTENAVILGGKKFFLTHGHLFGVKSGTERLVSHAATRADFVLYGHTHIPHIGIEAGVYILNPGSANMQRNRNPTFALIEVSNGVSIKILSLEYI
jgi:putative phosphoesterase